MLMVAHQYCTKGIDDPCPLCEAPPPSWVCMCTQRCKVKMLSRRRCCINIAVLVVLTLLSALILIWSQAATTRNHGDENLPIIRPRQPDSSPLLGGSSLTADKKTLDEAIGDISPVVNHLEDFSKEQAPAGNFSKDQFIPVADQKLLKRFPHVMIIGFGKAGTKALYEALKLHPQLSGPYKEQRFFSQHYSIGLNKYLRSLPDPPKGGYNSEKSPDYIIVPEAPKRIKSAASLAGVGMQSLKFVVVLRDPVDRAMSEYIEWNILRKTLNRPRLAPFEEMVVGKGGDVDSSQPFINASCYAYHIHNWLKHFSQDQMCYVDGDRFVTDPLKEVHQLEECLQLDHYFDEVNFVYDAAKGFYCFQGKNPASNSVCMNKSKGRKHPAIAQDVEKKLRSYFQSWDDHLPELIGRPVSWSIHR